MKTIVVASGKGGTGKTTLTALFALNAAETHTTVVADADVEASNLPIALAAHDADCDAFRGGQVARIDRVACANCGMCAKVCRFDAIIVPPMGDGRERHSVDPWACEGCGACQWACRYGAVTMEESSAGEACTAVALTGPIAYGQLGPGEDLSGRLVTEVRDRAKTAAEGSNAELLIIDGPPGVGCPVISAITNTDLLVAVTEPTVSGVHDLARLVTLARQLDVGVVAILNKADLSDEGASRVREFCATEAIDILAEIPFDRELSQLLPQLAVGTHPTASSPGLIAAQAAWREVAARSELAE